jgi:hypothetical protein
MSPDSRFPARVIASFSLVLLSVFLLSVATTGQAAAQEAAAPKCLKPFAQRLRLPGKLRNLDVRMDVEGFSIDGNRVAFVAGQGWTIDGTAVDPLEGALSIKDEKVTPKVEVAKLVFHGTTAEIQVLDSQPQITGEPRTKWQTAAKFEHFGAEGDQALTFSYYELGAGPRRSLVYDSLFPPVTERDHLVHTVHMFHNRNSKTLAAASSRGDFGPPIPLRRIASRPAGAPIVVDPSARESAYESFGCGTPRVTPAANTAQAPQPPYLDLIRQGVGGGTQTSTAGTAQTTD